MKYFMRLLKRKKYKAVLGCLAFAILGLLVICSQYNDYIQNGFKFIDTNMAYNDSSWATILTSSNLGIILLGILLIWTGLFYFPSISAYAQNKEDFDIKSDDEYIYIKYKKYELKLLKETFSTSNNLKKDKNGKRIMPMDANRIYNYVMIFHKEDLEKNIKK